MANAGSKVNESTQPSKTPVQMNHVLDFGLVVRIALLRAISVYCVHYYWQEKGVMFSSILKLLKM